MKTISSNSVCVLDEFWKKEIDLIRERVIPYQWRALNDQIPEANPSYCMHNYKVAAKINDKIRTQPDYKQPVYSTNDFCIWPVNKEKVEDRFYGFLFQDSDFSKWIEAVAYSLKQTPNVELEKIADEAIDIVCAAQLDDGYLDTFYIINDINKRFTNLRDNHELYCLGHLIEGAVAYYEATGKDKLLKTACRFADCVANYFGEEKGKEKGYPGHEIAEMALARLYELTGDEKYLNLGLYFINERGKKPYYFDIEHPPKNGEEDKIRYEYHQAHLPVRLQGEATGHAVRAVYLYSGMADFARITGDESLKKACMTLWNDITTKKMYITGGIGGTNVGEAFSFAYDLPNDTAYAETCASIGLVFFAQRMLKIDIDSRYADVMERALYNGVLSGISLDGTSFFYVNPLEVLPEACYKDKRKEHVKPVRQKWFGCACCPPNLARLISSIGSYIYTETEDTLYIHLYIGNEVEKKIAGTRVKLNMQSGFPWNGNVTINIKSEKKQAFTLALRIPDWSDSYHIEVNNAEIRVEKGYLYITKEWTEDIISITFSMEVHLYEASAKVRENVGKVTLMRGPIVYCLEEVDNGKNLHLLKVNQNTDFIIASNSILNEPINSIITSGFKEIKQKEQLYHPYQKKMYEPVNLKWIPYYAWANRGEGEMQVWVRI